MGRKRSGSAVGDLLIAALALGAWVISEYGAMFLILGALGSGAWIVYSLKGNRSAPVDRPAVSNFSERQGLPLPTLATVTPMASQVRNGPFARHDRHEALRAAFARELDHYRKAERDINFEQAWMHLERAHILGQHDAWPHVRVHLLMAGFACRRRDLREVFGQLPRILLAAPGSWTGRSPRGNTGGADVGIFTPMEIPADLEELLRP